MTEIYFDELWKNLKNYLCVDIRNLDEIENTGKLPGALHLPLNELENALHLSAVDFRAKYGFLQDSQNKLVIYCRSGRRVAFAHDILTKNGFTKHWLYKGSFLDWISQGGPIERLEKGVTPILVDIVGDAPSQSLEKSR